MLEVRDLTHHPGAAVRASAPETREALVGLGFEPQGHVELPTAQPTPVREILLSSDGLTVALLWSSSGKELLTLLSVLDDGTMLETDARPGPKLLRAFSKPGYPGMGLRSTQGPTPVPQALDHHRRFVAARAKRTSSPSAFLGDHRLVLAALERMARAEMGILIGTFVGLVPNVAVGALYMFWVRMHTIADTLPEALAAAAPAWLPQPLALAAPFLALTVAGSAWPFVFTRVSLGRSPTVKEMLDAGTSDVPPAAATGPAEPNRARWRHSSLSIGVPLPLPPLLLLTLLMSPLVTAILAYVRPAGYAQEYARKYGVDERMFGDWTELLLLVAFGVVALLFATLRQHLEIAPKQVTFRPMKWGFRRRVYDRSAVVAVWLRGPALASSRLPGAGIWEVLIVLEGADLPLVVAADHQRDRRSSARVADELARRLGVPFIDEGQELQVP